MRLRLEELGLTAADLARLSGVSYRSVISALAGDSAIRDRRGAVERALRWEPGSLYRAYKHGQPPKALEDETVEDVLQEIAVSRADLEALRDLANRLLEQYPLPERPAEHRDDRTA